MSIRTLVVDFSEAHQEPQYQFNTEVLGGRLLKVSFSDALRSPWISVSDALPSRGVQVLVSNCHLDYLLDTAVFIDGEFRCANISARTLCITHWMPIPELPEGD